MAKRTTTTTTAVTVTVQTDHQTAVADSEQAYEAARAARKRLREEHAQVSTRDQIIATWRRGDRDTYTPTDLLIEDIKAKDYYPALERHHDLLVRDIERKRIPLDLGLAEAAANVLSIELGLNADARATEPSLWTYVNGTEPRLTVIQRGPHTVHDAGRLSGRLTVCLTRSKHHRPLDAAGVLDILERHDWRFPTGRASAATVPCCDGERDEYSFDVGYGWPLLTVVTEPLDLDGSAGRVTSLVCSTMSKRLGGYMKPLPRRSGVKLVSDQTADGLRSITVQVDMFAMPHRRQADPAEARQAFHQGVHGLTGFYLPVGKIDQASVTRCHPGHDGGERLWGVAGTVELTAVSKAA